MDNYCLPPGARQGAYGCESRSIIATAFSCHYRPVRLLHMPEGSDRRTCIWWGDSIDCAIVKRAALITAVLSAILVLLLMGREATRTTVIPDAFSADSFWNSPIPADARIHPSSGAIVEFLAEDNALDGCITLAGPADAWGMPIYLADADSTTYNVQSSKYTVPAEFASLRIPPDARSAQTSDAEMVVYDLDRGFVAQLSKANYDIDSDTWTVSGGSIAYLDSNGLDARLEASDDQRNSGSFRGYNGAVSSVHFDDVANGQLDNVVKIGVNNSSTEAIPPMVGSDGDLTRPDAPLQGMRLRIRPDLDLSNLGLSDQALIIARGLQEYGAIIGDSTGSAVVLKLEDTERSGLGGRWNLHRESLCAITSDDFVIVESDLE